MKNLRTSTLVVIAVVALCTSGCKAPSSSRANGAISDAADRSKAFACDADNGGITLPPGFCALVVADSLGRGRHLAVRSNGDVYLALRRKNRGGGVVALRDVDSDGRADSVAYFAKFPGTGIKIRGSFLYFAPDTLIERYRLAGDSLVPGASPEPIVTGFPSQRGHSAKPFEFDESGNLYVNVGAPSNACQDPPGLPGAAGIDPCPFLGAHGGVWQFRADVAGQTYSSNGRRFATGIRNGVANAWNRFTDKLYVVQHGRDQLSTLWPEIYSDSVSAELPAEEMLEVGQDDDFGWPYCYYDHLQDRKVLSPEYGGDGTTVGRCALAKDPVIAFPGHWAPNDLLFYDGDQFPERYREGAFVAFHGSWNRSPLPQEGFNVVFVPFAKGKPIGDYEIFADGFAGERPIMSRSDARYRPMGLALGPDGSLYISDSQVGRIWRVMYN